MTSLSDKLRYLFGVPGADSSHLPPRASSGSGTPSIYARAMSGMRGIGAPLALGELPEVVSIPGVPQPVSAPAPDPSTFRVVGIPLGQRGTEATLQAVGDLAWEAARDPFFVQFSQGVTRACAARDYDCIRSSIYDFVVQNVKYANDSSAVEQVQSPGWLMFVSGQGDCDCTSALICAMLISNGLEASLRAVWLDPNNPTEATHVFPMGKHSNEDAWVPMDTVAGRGVGFQPPESSWVRDPVDYVVMGS